jgi:hypothetical protein
MTRGPLMTSATPPGLRGSSEGVSRVVSARSSAGFAGAILADPVGGVGEERRSLPPTSR